MAHAATAFGGSWKLMQSDVERAVSPSLFGQYYRVADAEGNSGSTRLLRRKQQQETLTEEYLDRQRGDMCSDDDAITAEGVQRAMKEPRIK